jgi:hypothetical protein
LAEVAKAAGAAGGFLEKRIGDAAHKVSLKVPVGKNGSKVPAPSNSRISFTTMVLATARTFRGEHHA